MRNNMKEQCWDGNKRIRQSNDDYIEVKMPAEVKSAIKRHLNGREMSLYIRNLILKDMRGCGRDADISYILRREQPTVKGRKPDSNHYSQ